MPDTISDFVAQFISPAMLVAPAGIWALLWWVNKRVMQSFHVTAESKWKKVMRAFRRALPTIPMILGVAAAWMPGALPLTDGAQWGEKLLKGLWCGLLASIFKKIIDQTWLGKDKYLVAETDAIEEDKVVDKAVASTETKPE
jgi:hypothetical protein